MRQRLVELFRDHFGVQPQAILEMGGDGSTRSYWRLVGPELETAVGAIGPDREENRAWVSFTRTFRERGLPVPELYGVDEEHGVWLQEDLGDTTLYEALVELRAASGERFPPAAMELYRRVVETLPRFQVEGGEAIDFSAAYPREAFDERSILWDLNYFKYHFLKLAHVPFNEARLERDFEVLAERLLEARRDFFLYRDFQSRNVMLRDGEPWFIDYQGGRKGALPYDLASLLYDAKAEIPDEAREELTGHYLDALSDHVEVDRDAFREDLRAYVLVRIMQAMGAYGYRGFFERKTRFLQGVVPQARNIEGILDRGLPLELPELQRVFRRIVKDWARHSEGDGACEGLTLHLQSFSYVRGYPEDRGGHGGGFVFDCRALPNPGRQLEFRTLSGLDAEVVEHLEARPEVHDFWESALSLVENQIHEYRRRGFDSLTVAFGCTGGQHRSVYFVERLARHLAGNHPGVTADVEHRERRRWPGQAD